MEQAHYDHQAGKHRPSFRVVYIVNATRKKLFRDFESPYLAHRFANRVRHGGSCTLVSWPPNV